MVLIMVNMCDNSPHDWRRIMLFVRCMLNNSCGWLLMMGINNSSIHAMILIISISNYPWFIIMPNVCCVSPFIFPMRVIQNSSSDHFIAARSVLMINRNS